MVVYCFKQNLIDRQKIFFAYQPSVVFLQLLVFFQIRHLNHLYYCHKTNSLLPLICHGDSVILDIPNVLNWQHIRWILFAMAAYLHLAVSENQQPKALSMDVHCRPGTWKFLPMLLDLAVSESQRQGLSMDLHCHPGNGNFYQCS